MEDLRFYMMATNVEDEISNFLELSDNGDIDSAEVSDSGRGTATPENVSSPEPPEAETWSEDYGK